MCESVIVGGEYRDKTCNTSRKACVSTAEFWLPIRGRRRRSRNGRTLIGLCLVSDTGVAGSNEGKGIMEVIGGDEGEVCDGTSPSPDTTLLQASNNALGTGTERNTKELDTPGTDSPPIRMYKADPSSVHPEEVFAGSEAEIESASWGEGEGGSGGGWRWIGGVISPSSSVLPTENRAL